MRGATILALVLAAAGLAGGWALIDRWLAEPTIEALAPLEGVTIPPEDGLEPPTATAPAMPETDVSGRDVAGLPRYPRSVRTRYERKTRGGIIVTETKYLADAELDKIHEFYREVFRSEDWSVADISLTSGERDFFVVNGEREASVRLTSRDEPLVEIELELSRPSGERTGRKPSPPDTPPRLYRTPAPTPVPERVPEQVPVPAPEPAPVPSPVQEPPPATPTPVPVPGPAPGPAPAPVTPPPAPSPSPAPPPGSGPPPETGPPEAGPSGAGPSGAGPSGAGPPNSAPAPPGPGAPGPPAHAQQPPRG